MTTRAILRAIAAAGLLAACAASVTAQPYDRHTIFTFSAPVTVPGVTLPAGTYEFRLAEMSSHNVVQVVSPDGATSYAMFFALREPGVETASNPELRFMETTPGLPPAIKTWWYPGAMGFDFVYSRDQLQRITR